ncbi:MAG: transporter [Solirubrobacterales bacterium]|nr:transporter [Solirubrobacterales bacterium]
MTAAAIPASAETETDRMDARAWGALLVLCGALFLDGLDVSMVGVALPSIRSDLHLSTSSLQWVVSGYILGYGGLLLLGGRAADLLGRRRVFLIALGVFLVASALGGLVSSPALLIATRFIKGASAAFTAPAGLSIITTTFAEGPARNRALSIYTATGASGFSLGLVFGGLLTTLGWRFTFFLPVPIALALLIAAPRLLRPDQASAADGPRRFDAAGGVAISATMLLLVYTVVSAPTAGWASARTLLSFLGVAALATTFVTIERRSAHPLVRLGILRSGTIRRANFGAMAVFGGWVGVQFIATLYMQQLRGWSAITTALAILPGGAIVALGAPRMAGLVDRFGTTRLVVAGMVAFLGGYLLLFLDLGTRSSYPATILPTMVLAGLGFMLAYGPLNMAATSGVADHEQGLASGLVNTSFQIGGAIGLAVVTAVIDAGVSSSNAAPGSATALLDGYHAGIVVAVVIAALGLWATMTGPVGRTWQVRVAARREAAVDCPGRPG